jgi:hypothetical protein
MKVWKILAGAALLASCSPEAKTATLTLDVTAAAVDSMVRVTNTWRPGADDGRGALLGFMVRATGGSPAKADSIQVASTVRSQVITLGPYAIGSTQTGQGCVKALRRALGSAYVCKPWTVTLVDQAPPVAIQDSVRTSTTMDTLVITQYFRAGVTDGAGVATIKAVAADAGTPVVDRDSVMNAASPAVIKLTGYTYGQTVTGTACVQAQRRGLSSGLVCTPFTQVITDVPPPPPIVDSVTALLILPDAPQLATMFPACASAVPQVDANGYPVAACVDGTGKAPVQQFCGMFQKSDGYYYLLSGQEGLGICKAAYDALPSGKLPGYPTASVRPWKRGPDSKLVLRTNTRKEELAAIVFENPYTPKYNVFSEVRFRQPGV